MTLGLRVRETEAREPGSDDEPPDPPEREPYEPVSPAPLRLRCYACAGHGRLWVVDKIWPRGRQIRCIACRGSGRVTIP